MAEAGGGFRIGRGFLDIVGKVNKEQTRQSANEAAEEAGDTFEKGFTRHWEKQNRDARGRFVKGWKDHGDAAGAASALRFGAKFGSIMTDLMAKAGQQTVGRFFDGFSALPPQAQAAIGAGVVGAAMMAAPLISGVIAGAVVGGVGIGGVVGGILIAASHPEVKAAAKLTGQSLKSEMQQAGRAFVPEVLHSLQYIRTQFREMGSEMESALSGLSRFVEPLTRGVVGFVHNLLPGFQAIADYGMPVIQELADWLPRLGTLLSDVFTMFATRSFDAATALQQLWIVFELGIRSIAGTLAGLAELNSLFEKMAFVVTGNYAGLIQYLAAEEAAKAGGDELNPTLQQIIAGFQGTGEKAAFSTGQIKNWLEALREGTTDNLDFRAAQREAEQAIDDATQAFKDNGRTIDNNTAKGRANNQALDRLAAASNKVYDATYKQTGSQEAAAAAAQRSRDKFIALAQKMGYTKDEAIALAGKLIAIPSPKRSVTVETTKAQAAVRGIKSALATINGRTVLVTVKYETKGRVPGEHIIGQGTLTKAEGGWVNGAGGPTDDKIPAMLSNKEFVLRAHAADKLTKVFGPEFLPWLNNYDRALGTWDRHPVIQAKRKQWGSRMEGHAQTATAGGGTAVDTRPASVQIDRVEIRVDAADLTDMQRVLDLFESLPTVARQHSVSPTTGAR